MPSIRYSKERRIVLLDQQPLREEAGGEAKRIMREVNEHAEMLAEFDRTMRPAYERWEAENLGPLLEEERRLHAKIADLEHRIDLADFESYFTGRDPFEIFEETGQESEPEDANENPEDKAPPEPDPDEAAVKRAMVACANFVVVVADSSKVGREEFVSFAGLDALDVLVTDSEISEKDRSALTDAGLEVVVAQGVP